MCRSALLTAAVALLFVASASPAMSDVVMDPPESEDSADGSSTEIDVGIVENVDGSLGAGSRRRVKATPEQIARWRMMEENRRTGLPAYSVCMANGGSRAECLAIFDRPGEARPPGSPGDEASTFALVREAVSKLAVSHPGIRLSPPVGNPTWVHIPVWMWVDGGSWTDRYAEATSADGLVGVNLMVYPISVRWDMGNGDEVVCDGPGEPYDYSLSEEEQSSDCSYTYVKTPARQGSKRFTVTSIMEWGGSWVASNGLEGSVGPFRLVEHEQIEVGQIQALHGR